MRFAIAWILLPLLASACKTTRNARSAETTLDSLDNEDQLPACDDITVGRVYWVRSLKQQMFCAEGGTWQPREIEAAGKDEPGFSPRTIP